MGRLVYVWLFALVFAGCGDTPGKGKNSSSNNETVNNSSNINPDCGDGVLQDDEFCDPQIVGGPGACPEQCAAGACVSVELVGQASDCSARCVETVAACGDGDACCPAGCDATADSDCVAENNNMVDAPVCGNGEIETGEICDGDCPTSCNDNDACTTDAISGAPNTCNVVCTNSAINACVSGDGCCPSGCSFQTDGDCACIPTTCQQMGKECGNHPDGCGGVAACGGCAADETCNGQGICEITPVTPGTGSACNAETDCDSSLSNRCLTGPDWPGGYCSNNCLGTCDNGDQCGFDGVCLKACNDISDCRQGYDCLPYFLFGGGSASVCVGP